MTQGPIRPPVGFPKRLRDPRFPPNLAEGAQAAEGDSASQKEQSMVKKTEHFPADDNGDVNIKDNTFKDNTLKDAPAKTRATKSTSEPDLTEPQPLPDDPNDPRALHELGRPADVAAETVLKKVTPEKAAPKAELPPAVSPDTYVGGKQPDPKAAKKPVELP